ncbi:LCP family protein [Solirubrobacter sp. CPCC 204708]|uniref:LCP family protein n=1 Tax=Solirubrobacter deserti TaxID=2282478 RepID=A0ABT4RH64_9ACTN|nr:LCP family protein [Solirubrobacter deserti]MBE2315194.1 LCP family protein [Solirubrobacter deserti]MDA0137877.1 LCP family protein [Solirubrobacter deserti]
MRRRYTNQERPPRVGARVLAKALVGVLLIFISTGAGVAIAGYLMIAPPIPDDPAKRQAPIPDLPEEVIVPVEPGGPRTILVLGSDRRAKTSRDAQLGQREKPHSDTIVLVRLDPKRHRVAVLSLPRDLAVTIPGFADNTKINQAYDEGGARLTLDTVKHFFESAVGRTFNVNGVIDVNFDGFQRAVNHVGGIYVDVDREYYNPEGTGFASIDIDPGYQRLVGSDALDYVRFRHTDSDLFRGARQQDFLRQATTQRSVRELKSVGEASELLGILQEYFRFDKKFLGRRNLAGLLKTAVHLAMNDTVVNQISLTGITESEDPVADTRLYISNENIQKAYDAFMTGDGAQNPERSTQPVRTPKRKKGNASTVSGMVDARRLGEDMAVLAEPRLKRLPFYFPGKITSRTRYTNDTPRIYSLRDEDGRLHRAYRMVGAIGESGEYWGVQGLTWRNPPILENPDRIRKTASGRELMLFYDGKKIRMVGWRTPRAAYWISNTIGRKISNARMIEIASSLRRLKQ